MIPNPEMIAISLHVDPEMIPSNIKSWNEIVFYQGIITSLLQRLHFSISFHILLQFMFFFQGI